MFVWLYFKLVAPNLQTMFDIFLRSLLSNCLSLKNKLNKLCWSYSFMYSDREGICALRYKNDNYFQKECFKNYLFKKQSKY